jgi:MarR family transcriptional regulator, organic hydroperoxide resistance regulator
MMPLNDMAARTAAEEAWELLWRIMQANKRRMMELARDLDFSPVQLHLLRLIEPGVETPMRALARQLFCDPSNVTGIVDRLVARGLVERRESETDRRVKIIRLTPEGHRVRARVMEHMSAPPPEIATLPTSQQRALRDALRAAAERLEDERPSPADTLDRRRVDAERRRQGVGERVSSV